MLLLVLQDSLTIPLPDKPDGSVAGWMLWVMALAVVAMGYAVYRMFLKFTEDKAALLAEVQKAKGDAVTQLETARVVIEGLHKELATLNRELGMATASLEFAKQTIQTLREAK